MNVVAKPQLIFIYIYMYLFYQSLRDSGEATNRINTNKFKHLYFIYMTVSEAHNGEAITTVGRGHK